MVISVKKENEKLLNLPTITREILAYCDTEEALENLKEEWSNFKNFRPAIELIENYTIQNEADEDFDLTKETSATKVISNYFEKEKPMKWDDLSDDFKNDYNVILDNLQKHLNKLIFQFKGVSLSYDTHNKKFVFSRKRNESDDYRNFNCLLKGNGLENFISTSLLVLVDLTRFSSISNSYKTKVEFIWFKYIFGVAELEEFLKELLVQAKRDSKAKLKSFVNNVEFDGDYPAKLFNKKFIEGYIYKSVVVAARSSKTVTVEHILNTNEDEYFNSILKECLDVSKLSDQAFYALVKNESDSFIIGYSDLPEDLKVEFVRDVIKRWGHQISPLSNMLTKKELNDYFSRKEIFGFFKETLKELLEAIFLKDSKFRGKFSEEFIVINNKLVFVDYIKRHDPSELTSPLFLTEDEVSEFKSEVVPLLEKIKDEVLYKAPSNNFSIIKGEIGDKSSLLVKLLMDNRDITTHSFVPYLQNMFGIIPNKFDLFFDGNLSEYAKEELLDFLAVDDIINFENLNILVTESENNINTTRIGYKYNSKIVKLLNKQDYDNLALLADYGSGIRCPIFFKKIKIG